jgi:hypothetical protein
MTPEQLVEYANYLETKVLEGEVTEGEQLSESELESLLEAHPELSDEDPPE